MFKVKLAFMIKVLINNTATKNIHDKKNYIYLTKHQLYGVLPRFC
ncbi:hypothetical protein BN863_18780 [Formosa agariphila KMM 3901]|uniref:Uncharacterized protein n=1 Tax=Formosa agariphila (strain DSM 15362 / KCTC 12365 / LMG 23005 / KMM 3901 / M-2Alg 35-1) TaxID=1347342 RepID=T2KLF8_FORAG|nr:hypothetical protein BN863_18780 [Formosa agariphila KMM 3901]